MRRLSHDRSLIPHVRAPLPLCRTGMCVRQVMTSVDGVQRQVHAVHAPPSRRLPEHVHGDAPPDEAASAHVARELHAQRHRHERHGGRAVDASVQLQVRFELRLHV